MSEKSFWMVGERQQEGECLWVSEQSFCPVDASATSDKSLTCAFARVRSD